MNVLNTHKLLTLYQAKQALDYATKAWFIVALIGQWSFGLYVLIQYALPLVTGISETNVKSLLPSNSQLLFLHIIPTIYIAGFGILQLVPRLRNQYKRFHRWNGRIFLTLGILGAATGLYLQFVKGMVFSQGVALNGALIIVFALPSWYFAKTKRFDIHQRFAVHTFLLVNGVWSFRLYLMAWLLINQGPNGNTPNVDGPMDVFISFACYLLPMFVAEFYFWAKKQRAPLSVLSGMLVMSLGAMITLLGVIAAATMLWLPRISKTFMAL